LIHLGRRFAQGECDLAPRASRWSNLAADIGRSAAAQASRTSRLANSIRELGPYAAIALILPGGSLIALALLSRRHRGGLSPWSRRGLVLVALLAASIMLPGSM
jgi:hypothetical protein